MHMSRVVCLRLSYLFLRVVESTVHNYDSYLLAVCGGGTLGCVWLGWIAEACYMFAVDQARSTRDYENIYILMPKRICRYAC